MWGSGGETFCILAPSLVLLWQVLKHAQAHFQYIFIKTDLEVYLQASCREAILVNSFKGIYFFPFNKYLPVVKMFQ